MDIDLATIEKGSSYLGMVASIPPEDQYTQWRSEYESDIIVAVASLAGERLFYGGDNSSGVSGDLRTATLVAALMESQWGMGSGISSLPALQDLQIGGGTPEDRKNKGKGGGIGFGVELKVRRDEAGGPLPQRIESNLVRLLEEAEQLLDQHRAQVLSLAHALETHKTLSGEDVVAVLEGKRGELVDGTPYRDTAFLERLERYHEKAVVAHTQHAPLTEPMPVLSGAVIGELVPEPVAVPWAATTPQQARPPAAVHQPYPGSQTYPYPGPEPYPAQQPYPPQQQPYPAPPYPAPPQQGYPGHGPYPGQYPAPGEQGNGNGQAGNGQAGSQHWPPQQPTPAPWAAEPEPTAEQRRVDDEGTPSDDATMTDDERPARADRSDEVAPPPHQGTALPPPD
jgi:hypothetical protein